MTKELKKRLQIAVSKYALGRLPGEGIPAVAIAVLEEGIENEEILELAGLDNPTVFEAEQAFLGAVSKLGLHIPDIPQATLYLAKVISEQICAGSISPYEGARKIWWELSNIKGANERLKCFAGLASEYEDTPNDESRKDYERQILKEACFLSNEME